MAQTGKLSKLNIIVAQLESIVAAAAHKLPEPLICFDLLVDLLSTIDQETKDSILGCQRKCEDALQALLILGVRPPVRRLASTAMVCLIEKGDNISVYSRAGNLQGWLSDKMDKKSDPASCIGVAQCLGALLRAFGQKISSGLVETSSIVAKLMRYSEVGVRQAAFELLQDALEGSGGGGALTAYSEALKIIMKLGATDKSAVVRAAAAGCLRAFAVMGGPGLALGGLENCATVCLKALEDSAQPVRDGFAAALGALLALGHNPQAQAQPKGRGPLPPLKIIDGGLQKHLITPFVKASGQTYKEIRVGLTMAWVAFLQGMRLNYMRSDLELQEFAMQAIKMLALSSDTHAQACVLFCLRVGIVEQMGEPAQKGLTDHLIKQLSTPDVNSAMFVVILRTLAHLLSTLGEVSIASRETLDNSLVGMLSNSSMAVRVEAALALRTLAEVDASSANNLMSFGLTTLRALRETVSVEKGDRLKLDLDSLHGQAAMLAALLTACPKLVLGVPSRLPLAVWDVAKVMVLQKNGNPMSMGAEKEAGWMLIASILSSLPKEELESQKLEILVLWASEFGGNAEDSLKKAESMLATHLSGWSAAVEALTAFVKSFVVPNMSATEEGILLQPIIGYLSGALAYLSSSTLQQAPAMLKPAINLFTIRTLRAFQALPDPFAYKDDHVALLSICTAPFRDPGSCGASSCLRQLLDSRDASLGPWIPGRDSFEDELRAFEGGAQGVLPCVWAYEVPAFPQPLPVATVLIDEMLLSFGIVFAAQTEKSKLQLLDIILDSARAGKKQIWHSANITNICVALLGGLKASIGMRSPGSEVDAMKQVQEIFQGILSEDGLSPVERRAAAEGLGVLARLGSDVFAARLTRSLLSDSASSPLPILKSSIALALGCVHRSVGGMALSALVPATVQALCAWARDPNDTLHVWALHGLWLTADAAGLSYVPHVQATLSLAMEILLSEDHAAPELGQSIGRLVNAVVAVLGPELSPGSSLFSRCKAMVAEISTENEPAAQLECVLFTQQLALFAPRAVPVHAHVQTLRRTLTSRQPSLRQAAVSTLRHLSERDPVAMVEEHIEEDLFAMLDNETDESIIQIVRSTLQRLLEAACPSFPSRWLHLCRNVVLATSTTKSAGAGFQDAERLQAVIVHEDMGEDNEGMIADRPSTGLSGAGAKVESKTKDTDQLPRYKTRVFAAECLCRLPVVVGVEPAHFDLLMVKQLEKAGNSSGGDWLVLHLGELVAVAYQVATGTMESVRPMGVELLDIVLDKFGETVDPEFEGHLLLEQYQAQLVSAVRTALDSSAGPLLMAAGSRLAARIITSGGASGDRALLQRMVNLLTQPLLKWEDIVNPNYAEWVGCKVQVSLLGAHAAVKSYAFACSRGSSKSASDGVVILPLLSKHSDILGRFWIGILRDYTALRLHATTKAQPGYKPFMEGIHLVSIASMVLHFLSEVWPVVLEAVTIDAYPAGSSMEPGEDRSSSGGGTEISVEDFKQIWALAVLVLSEEDNQAGERRRTSSSFPSVDARFRVDKYEYTSQLAALHSLQCLCSEEFYTPDMLSVELCKEIVLILSNPFVNGNASAAHAVLSVLDQIAKSCPQGYMECKDISLKIIELCLGNIFQLLTRRERHVAANSDESERVLTSALETLGNLVRHLNTEVDELLLPQLLSAGIKILNLVRVDGTVASAALGFITNVTKATANPLKESSSSEEFNPKRMASILAAAVETLAQDSKVCAEDLAKSDQVERSPQDISPRRLELLLGVMVAIARSMREIITDEENVLLLKRGAQERCISCLRWFLANPSNQVQLAALQTLRTVAQAGATEQKEGQSRMWAIILLRELGGDVTQVVYDVSQNTLTADSAAAVGECMKLLILLYSLVEGGEAQQNVLHLLLPVIITAASFQNQGSTQETTAMTAAALKLVTHLASVPSSATQFRNVLLQLPPESRQQLQAIIKASMSQQPPSSVVSAPAPAPVPLAIPKFFTPGTPSSGKGLIPPPSSLLPLPIPAIPQPAFASDFDDDEDDWDDFQEGSQDVDVSTSATDVDVVLRENVDDFQPFSAFPSAGPSAGMNVAETRQSRNVEGATEFEAFTAPTATENLRADVLLSSSSSSLTDCLETSQSGNAGRDSDESEAFTGPKLIGSLRADATSLSSPLAGKDESAQSIPNVIPPVGEGSRHKDAAISLSTFRSRESTATEEELNLENDQITETSGISTYSIPGLGANETLLEASQAEDASSVHNTPYCESTYSVSLSKTSQPDYENHHVIDDSSESKSTVRSEVDSTSSESNDVLGESEVTVSISESSPDSSYRDDDKASIPDTTPTAGDVSGVSGETSASKTGEETYGSPLSSNLNVTEDNVHKEYIAGLPISTPAAKRDTHVSSSEPGDIVEEIRELIVVNGDDVDYAGNVQKSPTNSSPGTAIPGVLHSFESDSDIASESASSLKRNDDQMDDGEQPVTSCFRAKTRKNSALKDLLNTSKEQNDTS